MNADLLLQHFDRLSEAPDALPRLRRFILDLAVRGRLVPQDPNDEPASGLLRRIAAERAKQLKSRKKTQLVMPFESEDMPFELPESWQWVQFVEVASIESNLVKPEQFLDYPHIAPDNIESRTGRLLQYQTIRESGVFSAKNRFFPGHIVYSKIRPNLAKATLVDFEGLCSADMYPIYPFINPIFLLKFMLSDAFVQQSIKEDNRVAMPKINQKSLSKILVAVPPLAEQQRIVARVDDLMALCDQLEAAKAEREQTRNHLIAASLHHLNQPSDDTAAFREHARFYFNHLPRLTTRPEHIKQLRQTILNLAVRGKLVPQDPNDEPAAELLKKLKSALARMKEVENIRIRKSILPDAINFFSEDTFPASWCLTNFDDVNVIVSGVAKGKNLKGFKTEVYPYLRVANVQRGYLDLQVMKELEIKAGEFERYRLCDGDVLMTEGGDWDKLGRAAIWNNEIPDCIHQNHIYRIRPAVKELLLPKWIMLFANSPLGRLYFEGASKQTTNLASINMTQLRSCPLPLPPLAEQQRIVARVDDFMALCDELDATLSASATDQRRLLDAILHEALAPAMA
ncbi:MAG: restriction endonuclease subunit S [Ardenticatenales bacterium]|nr:restriction endonuclease subunit S [Ardenticatenales bacterium]